MRKGHGAVRTLALALLVLLAAGCTRQTVGGQTLARVNGEPITADDLALEMAALPAGQVAPSRGAVLQALIDRKLLAQDARARGEAQSADFVRQERRWREQALAARDMAIVDAEAQAGPDRAEAVLAGHRAALRAAAQIVVAPNAAAAPKD